jgi:hypothetical protein
MSSTITLTGDWLANIGNRMETYGTGNLGTYATAGVAVTANQVGLGTIYSMDIDPAGGYTFNYVPSTGKIKAYAASSGAFTATGTNTAPTITLTGTHTTTNTVSISGTNGSSLTALSDSTITGITGVQAPTFTGDAVAVSVAEVSTNTNLSTTTFTFRAIGI